MRDPDTGLPLIKPNICEFDIDNLRLATTLTHEMVGAQLYRFLDSELGQDATAVEWLWKVMQKMQGLSPQAVRELVQELRCYELKNIPGENAQDLGMMITDTVELILSSGQQINDLSYLAAHPFLSCSVQQYVIEIQPLVASVR